MFVGLWQVCFKDYEDPRHWYDTKFRGCWWVFEEEYYIIHNILLPGTQQCKKKKIGVINWFYFKFKLNFFLGFFVATQFFFTLTFTLLLIAAFLVAMYLSCSREHDRFVLLLFVIGSNLLLAGKLFLNHYFHLNECLYTKAFFLVVSLSFLTHSRRGKNLSFSAQGRFVLSLYYL